mmetsp:Transcript_78491/g.202130  ORF Transcript_78491/g.202130 Transcript_78491/m.202130 type:complete len:232 (+) Transcript_78491:648-1343(+)
MVHALGTQTIPLQTRFVLLALILTRGSGLHHRRLLPTRLGGAGHLSASSGPRSGGTGRSGGLPATPARPARCARRRQGDRQRRPHVIVGRRFCSLGPRRPGRYRGKHLQQLRSLPGEGPLGRHRRSRGPRLYVRPRPHEEAQEVERLVELLKDSGHLPVKGVPAEQGALRPSGRLAYTRSQGHEDVQVAELLHRLRTATRRPAACHHPCQHRWERVGSTRPLWLEPTWLRT